MDEFYFNYDYEEDIYYNVDTFEYRCCFNVDHCERSGCYYIDGNASGSDFSDNTFEDRCTLTSTTSRTATVPTATRRNKVASTMAKE